MGLFKIPKRDDVDIHNIIAKSRDVSEYKPKIKLKGTTLTEKLISIAETVKRNLGDDKDNYLCITSNEDWIKYCEDVKKEELVSLDTETTGIDYKDQNNLVGVCIQANGKKPAYIPVGHLSNITESLMTGQVTKEYIKKGIEILLGKNCKFIFHNAYYDLVVMYLATGIWIPVYWDCLPAACLLNENESHSLKYLYDKYVAEGEAGVHKFNELFSGIPMCYIPYSVAYIYGAHDAEMTLELYKFQQPYLTRGTYECKDSMLERSADILREIELPLIPQLANMKVNGIDIDFTRAKELHDKYYQSYQACIEDYKKAIVPFKDDIDKYKRIHGDTIEYPPNYNSPLQISILLYDIIKIGQISKKSPRGVGAEVMDSILSMKKFKNTPLETLVKHLAKLKEYDKLLGSFVDKLPSIAKEYGGKIYCNFNANGARTGRMSSSDPKQNWAMMA